jgi:hypothetical protein
MAFQILYDEPQEAYWFKGLHPDLISAEETPISEARQWPNVREVLDYDRPDIVLLKDGEPVLVVEETIEVPSGHNVGQRFARIAAAAEQGVPTLYFGPFAAKKHGGDTAGPRYMNLRLFHALDAMERETGTCVTALNWPVDDDYEIRRDPDKDSQVKSYISEFLGALANSQSMAELNSKMLASRIHSESLVNRTEFIDSSVKRPEQYDEPPKSVRIISKSEAELEFGIRDVFPDRVDSAIVYNIGMRNVRSDPYTGMSILYRYLYATSDRQALCLWMPNIDVAKWADAAKNPLRKDVKLFSKFGDLLLFSDGHLALFPEP